MFKLSKGNSKLGLTYNANLPAIITCRKNAPCIKDCYACKGFYRMPSVIKRYAENLQAWQDNKPQTYQDILAQLPEDKTFLFRWHSSGDIPEKSYLALMVAVAVMRPNGQYLAFTKKYELINDWITSGQYIPDNLTIVYSVWDGLDCINPHNLPIACVSDTFTNCPALIDKTINCIDCRKCWKLKPGHSVVFKKH